jgi:site-specific DNA recombinase
VYPPAVPQPRSNPTAAREYLRVSVDRTGRQRSIDEQHADNQRTADEHGWQLGDPYDDIGSASRYATNGRHGYDTLVADIEAGRFGADVLVLWESSRGSRQVAEWCRLIDACGQHGINIAVTTHGRTYDPTNARDRRSLLEDAVDSEYESGKMSSRIRRDTAYAAVEGRPHGRIPYGYQRRYDPTNGRLVDQVPTEPEASYVRELFDRLAKGHSLRAIAADYDQRGIRTRTGRKFTSQHLRSLARSDSYRGKRIHIPGRRNGNRTGAGNVTPAAWPALVDDTTWLAVQRILGDETRRTNNRRSRPGGAQHLLSMIAVCDVCDGPLSATYRDNKGRRYQCRDKGHVVIGADALDAYAETDILAFLSKPDVVDRLCAPGDDAALADVRNDIAAIRAELDQLSDNVAQGLLSVAFAAQTEPGLRRRLEIAQTRETELATPHQLRGIIEPGADVAARWETAPMSARRLVARMLLVPEVIGQLRVTKSPVSGHRVDADQRVAWRHS